MADESSDNQQQQPADTQQPANTQQQQPANSGSQQPDGGSETPPANFEEWLARQDDAAKLLVSGHIGGLKTALESERTARKKLEKELRDAAKQLEDGSAARQSLEESANKLAAFSRQTTFYDAAHTAGVTNLRLAYLAAQEAGLVDDDGKADFDKVKAQFPELFPQKPPASAPKANAGSGAGQPAAPTFTMNDLIRQAAGRTT